MKKYKHKQKIIINDINEAIEILENLTKCQVYLISNSKRTALINFLKQQPENNQNWIRVDDRLPEIDDYVLVFINYKDTEHIDSFRFDGFAHWIGHCVYDLDQITHWMPLPDKPKI